MMRNIIDDEDQLGRIQDLQDQFFNDIAEDNVLIKEHLNKLDPNKKEKDKKDKINGQLEISDIDKISPHYDRL